MNPKTERFNLLWKDTDNEQKENLIKELGFNTSFSVCSSLQEMAGRGGAWLARDLLKCFDQYDNNIKS